MKKLVQAFVSLIIATSTFGGVTSVAAKENTPAYKVEYQDADSMKSVFKKELHKKYANVKFKKKTKNVSVYESKNYKVQVKNLDIDTIGKQTVSIEGENKKTSEKHSAEVKVKVQDTTAPEITCEDVLTVEQNEVFDMNSYVSLNEEGTIQLTDNINTADVGTFTTTIKAKDTAGNVSEKNITVNVERGFYQKIADAALAQIGVYQDCTMLVTNSLAAVGINFHGSPTAYLSLGTLTDNPVPGDICVYQGHVALYVGNGQAVHGGWLGNQTVLTSVACGQPFIGYVHVNR